MLKKGSKKKGDQYYYTPEDKFDGASHLATASSANGGPRTPGDYAFTTVLLLVSAGGVFGVVTYIRRLNDPSVQLLLDQEGIAGYRTKRGLIRWADIRAADLRVQRARRGKPLMNTHER